MRCQELPIRNRIRVGKRMVNLRFRISSNIEKPPFTQVCERGLFLYAGSLLCVIGNISIV